MNWGLMRGRVSYFIIRYQKLKKALIQAVKNNEMEKVNNLVSEMTGLEYTDSLGMTALLYACEIQSFDIVKILIRAGADVNHPNNLGYTPVDLASMTGEFAMASYTLESKKIVQYLKENGGKSKFRAS